MKKSLLALMLALVLLATAIPSMADEAASDMFVYENPITLKVSVFDRGSTGQTAVDNNYWTQWIQDNFGTPRNINMKWVVIPRSEEVAKLNILMASGEAADINFTYTESVITNFVKQGGIVELTDLLAEYGQGIVNYLGEDLLKYGIFEGGQYAIPAKRVVLAQSGVFIREDWLEKMGMALPTTKEEFYNCLVAIKEQNPGNVDNVIPFAYAPGNTLAGLSISFMTDLSERTLATVPDLMKPGYKDFLQFMNKLYNEGLISPDFALDINGAELKVADIAAGRAGGYDYNYDHPIRVSPGTLAALQAFEPDAKLTPFNAFESVIDPTKYYHQMYAPNGIANFIPVFSEHPEAAIMYLDWLSDMDNIFYLQNGDEGKHYTLNEDGVPVVNDINDDSKFNSMQNIDYTLLTNGQEFPDPELMVAAQAASYQGYEDLYENIYNVAMVDPLQTSFHFDVIIESDSKYSTSLSAKQNEIMTKCIMATQDEFSDLYDKLTAEYMAEGGQEVMDEKQAAWDKMQASTAE